MKHLAVALLALTLVRCDKDVSLPNHSANRKAVGASAWDLLASSTFASLVIEVQAMPGFELSGATMGHLENFLESRLNKPGGISIILTTVASSGGNTYDVDQIRQIEEANRTEYNTEGKIAVYCLVVDGEYEDNSGGTVTLGIAWRNTSVVLFGQSIHDLSDGLGEPDRAVLESTVLEHEFGHLLGLVDLGSDMQADHQDDPHGHHCDNTDCLMYYLAETGDVITTLLGGSIPALDGNCIADLQANGGK